MSFIGSFQRLVANIGPYFLHNPHVGALVESTGIVLDSAVRTLSLGLQFTQPLRCEASALPYLAKDRKITIYPSEPVESIRYRLAHWHQLHARRGTHRGELEHLQPYFLPNRPQMAIVHQDGRGAIATWHLLNSDGEYSVQHVGASNWNFDNHPEKWSRFWVIIYAADLLPPMYGVDGVTYGDGSKYGASAALTPQRISDIVQLVKEWKSAHSRLAGVIISTEEAINPMQAPIPGNWGSPLDSSGHFTRPNGAIWIYEDNP